MSDEVNKSTVAYNIEFRMALVVQHLLGGKNDWKRMEEMTGIKAVRWRHLNSGVTRASVDMLEAICALHPQYAFWITTGLSDYETGHVPPTPNLAFPEGGGQHATPGQSDTQTYFKGCLAALTVVWNRMLSHAKVDPEAPNAKERLMQAFRPSINTSIQLASEEQTWSLGAKEQQRLLRELSRLQGRYLDEVIARLRERVGVDKIIDEQRERDAEILRSVESNERRDKEE